MVCVLAWLVCGSVLIVCLFSHCSSNRTENFLKRYYLHTVTVEEIYRLAFLEVEVKRPERLVKVEHLGMLVEQVTCEGRATPHVGQEDQLDFGVSDL